MFVTRGYRVGLLILVLGAGPRFASPSPQPDSDKGPAPNSESVETTAASKAATAEERIGVLEETIRTLQSRLQELEARNGKSLAASGEITTPPQPAGADNPAPAPAKTDTAPPAGNRASFFDKIEFSGFADTYYGYNFNRPASRKNGLRNFDFNHNQFNLNLLEFALEKKAEPLGFRFDLDFGDTTKFVHSTEPGGSDVYQYLQQFYVSYKTPVGKGLTVDFGKFVTHMGSEVIESPSNHNYSRSLLFAYAIPYYHFGTRLSYPFTDKLTVAGLVVNGWNNVVDNNTGKSVGLSVNVTPIKKLNLIQNYIVGAEQNNKKDRRQVFDTVITFYATDRFTLMANYDFGMDRLAGERVRWQGAAGYLRFALTPAFAVTPRFEYFDDRQGFTTGLGQQLKEATLTTEYKLPRGLLVRAEYRRDWSNRPFFEKRANLLSRSQTTATLALMYIMGQEP